MKIPSGAIQIHLYNVNNILRPRGTLQKESISLSILEKLRYCYESWSDLKYGDVPTKHELLKVLKRNLNEEVENAWNEFIKQKIIEGK